MENASKALIIAGAILLSILIIALGMRVYNSANAAVAGADLSDTEVQAFIAKFESYDGPQKGSSVRALISAVNNINTNNPDRSILLVYVSERKDENKMEKLLDDSSGILTAATEIRESGKDAAASGTGGTGATGGSVSIQNVETGKNVKQNMITTSKTYEVGFIYDDVDGTVIAACIR